MQTLPADAFWAPIISWSNWDDIGNIRQLSTKFPSIVEKGCAVLITQYKLGKNNERQSSFERITYLSHLIQKWATYDYLRQLNSQDLQEFKQQCKANLDRLSAGEMPISIAFAAYVQGGVNPCDYRPRLLESNNEREIKWIETGKEDFLLTKLEISRLLKILSRTQSFSIQHFLEIPPLIEDERNLGYPFACMILLTPEVFPNHPAKDDLHPLIVHNVFHDLPFLLKNNSIKADQLLRDNFLHLSSIQIRNTIIFYLCNYDVERLYNLLYLIHVNGQMPSIVEKERESFRKILDLVSYDKVDREELFVKLLVLFKGHVSFITVKDIFSHLAENDDHLSLLDKLGQEYQEPNLTPCFHHAKTAKVVEKLFKLRPNDADVLRFDRSPLLSNLMKNNIDVAKVLIGNGGNLEGDKTITLVRFLVSKNSMECKWIVFKELISRVASVAMRCIKGIAYALVVTLAATVTFLALVIIGIKIADQFGLFS